MTAAGLLAAVDAALAAQGYQRAAGLAGLDAGYTSEDGRLLGLVLLPRRMDASGSLQAFEDGMQRLLTARQLNPADGLALAVDVSNAAERQAASYRRALNKYQNSVVFVDAGIGLLLLGHPRQADAWLAPSEVSPFLRQFDRWLAS